MPKFNNKYYCFWVTSRKTQLFFAFSLIFYDFIKNSYFFLAETDKFPFISTIKAEFRTNNLKFIKNPTPKNTLVQSNELQLQF